MSNWKPQLDNHSLDKDFTENSIYIYISKFFLSFFNYFHFPGTKELAWCRGSVMDCHTTAQGSIPSCNSVKSELHILRNGQYIWGCRL